MLGRLAIYRLLKAAYLRRGLGAKEWEARTKARVSLDRCPSTMWESSATPTRTSGPGNASLFIDSLHLSPEGGRLMAGIVARQLRLGDQASSPRAIGNE